jgi:hypothetical protein
VQQALQRLTSPSTLAILGLVAALWQYGVTAEVHQSICYAIMLITVGFFA